MVSQMRDSRTHSPIRVLCIKAGGRRELASIRQIRWEGARDATPHRLRDIICAPQPFKACLDWRPCNFSVDLGGISLGARTLWLFLQP